MNDDASENLRCRRPFVYVIFYPCVTYVAAKWEIGYVHNELTRCTNKG